VLRGTFLKREASFLTYKGCTPITNSLTTHSRRGLIGIALVVFLLITLSHFGFASDQDLKAAGCDLSGDEIAGLNTDASTNVQGLGKYEGTIRIMLARKEFEKLDCVADHVRSGKERFPGGSWKIHVFYLGLDSPVQYPLHATEQDWETLIVQLRGWLTARPQSVTAHIALASTYLQYAWEARGSGYSNTVSDSGWKLLNQRTAEGKRLLEEASTLPTKCPEWYLAMQSVSQSEGWSASDARGLFEQAYKFEPGYYYYAQFFADYLLPKWSGEKGDTEQFTKEITDRVGGDEGDALYFLIARYMICGCENDEPKLSWQRISKGYEALEKRYGTSMEVMNQIAFLATLYQDPIVADKTMARIGNQWDEEKWKDKANYDSWKEWAVRYAPVLAKRRADEASAEANMQTPEGLHYKTSFESSYKSFVRECAKTEAGSPEKFETLTCVGEHGTVEDVKIYSNAPVGACVYQKLREFQRDKATPFSPPPKAPYWIRLDLDGSEFSSGAGK
jgi:hypothetical protein